MNSIIPFQFFFFLSLTINCWSQIPSDCISAISIKQGITLEIDTDSLAFPENHDNIQFDDGPLTQDFNDYSLWFRIEVEEAGDLIFDIIPIMKRDIDFLLFKSIDGSCENMELSRVMISGETIGNSWGYNEPCIGPTGLAYGSEDIMEEAGCQDGSDNYLAPLQVEAGDVFYLAVLDFSYRKHINFLIRPGGTCVIR